MTIVCGTDFSDSATAATHAAAAIAARLGEQLTLVHVAGEPEEGQSTELVRSHLRTEATALGALFGIEVVPLVELGAPDERIVTVATTVRARMIVVSSLGRHKQARWLLGSIAERVAQSSPIPVLVARDGRSIEAWARGEARIRVMVGVEPTPGSRAALEWARSLRSIGDCELLVTRVVWPGEEQRRLGIEGPIPLDHLQPELERRLLAELREWAQEGSTPSSDDASGTSFLVSPGVGRVDSHLAQLAEEHSIGLLVIGTHQRAGLARLWQGSVSRGVLHGASMNVACVPVAPGATTDA